MSTDCHEWPFNMNDNTKKKPEVQPPTKPEIKPIRPAEPTSPINPQAQ